LHSVVAFRLHETFGRARYTASQRALNFMVFPLKWK